MKLLLTEELGRLAKWLRILGLDTEYSRESNSSSVIIQALREERIILTRNHRLPAGRGMKIVTLKEEQIKAQLTEVLQKLQVEVKPELMFSRCTICNVTLESAAKEEIKSKVPEYVFNTQERFYLCPKCSRVYWQGTHWGNVQQLLKEIGS